MRGRALSIGVRLTGGLRASGEGMHPYESQSTLAKEVSVKPVNAESALSSIVCQI